MKKLTTDLVMDVLLQSENTPTVVEIKRDYEAIQEAITEFDKRVWLGAGLREYVQAATTRGHKCQQLGQIEILLYAIAGRVVITLRDLRSESQISLITDATSIVPRMGMQSINAAKDEAIRFMRGAIHLAEAGALQFTPDEQVGM